MKVGHILEALNMKHAEYQSVCTTLRRYGIEFETLLSVNKRWFICFDGHHTALKALHTVKSDTFKLKRVDCHPQDVQLLKDSVPPPTYDDMASLGIRTGLLSLNVRET